MSFSVRLQNIFVLIKLCFIFNCKYTASKQLKEAGNKSQGDPRAGRAEGEYKDRLSNSVTSPGSVCPLPTRRLGGPGNSARSSARSLTKDFILNHQVNETFKI